MKLIIINNYDDNNNEYFTERLDVSVDRARIPLFVHIYFEREVASVCLCAYENKRGARIIIIKRF